MQHCVEEDEHTALIARRRDDALIAISNAGAANIGVQGIWGHRKDREGCGFVIILHGVLFEVSMLVGMRARDEANWPVKGRHIVEKYVNVQSERTLDPVEIVMIAEIMMPLPHVS